MQVTRPRLYRAEASRYLREQHGIELAPKTLRNWAVMGKGPRYHLHGNRPLYPVAELDAWAVSVLGELMTCTAQYTRG